MWKKNLDKELEDYADRLSEELRIEEKTKDDNQLTSEEKIMVCIEIVKTISLERELLLSKRAD